MSRYLTQIDVAEIGKLLSAPRLGTFLQLTASGKDEDAVELHQITMSLGIAIMAVTGLIEVALRNAVCCELNTVLGTEIWLRSPPPSIKWSAWEKNAIKKAESQAQRAIYSKMTGAGKIALDIVAFPNGVILPIRHEFLAKKRQLTIPVNDSQVVAQLTMNFWKRLFSEDYEKTLWKRALKKVFPNKKISRTDVSSNLEIIYEIRNRLAHHEPVYGRRLASILEAIDFVSINLGSSRPSSETAFNKLILPQRDILAGQVAIFEATFKRLNSPL